MLNISVGYNYAMAIMKHYKNDSIGLYNCFVYLDKIFSEKPLLNDVLGSYYISPEKKEMLFFEVFNDLGIYKPVFDFIFKNRRHEYVPLIVSCFINIYLKMNNVAKAEIVSSTELNGKNLSKISTFLKNEFNLNDVVLSLKSDPSLISGFLIYIDNKVLDLSIKGLLNRLGNDMLKN